MLVVQVRLLAALDEAIAMESVPHPDPPPLNVIRPEFVTLPPRVTSPVPVLVQVPLVATVIIPVNKLYEAP